MTGITLTGADERTSIVDLHRLVRFGAEIGLLLTFSPDGRNRYPCVEWLLDVATALNGRAALHICGGRARDELHARKLDRLVERFGRVQVNGNLQPAEVVQICSRYPTVQIVTQHTSKNLWLLPVESPNHAILVDGSGGRGISPNKWERPTTDKPIGYAGGLGPENLETELSKIAELNAGLPNGWWIDMEGKLRDKDDWFSVDAANRVMEIWAEAY
jgi:hypothetical protein